MLAASLPLKSSPQTPGRVRVPLRSPQAAAAEEVADGAGGRELGVAGVENHAEIFGDDGGLGAVLHLQQGGERGEQRGISVGQGGAGKTPVGETPALVCTPAAGSWILASMYAERVM